MSFEETVLNCSAPSLCGIKPASLFSLRKNVYFDSFSKIEYWKDCFFDEGIRFEAIEKENIILLFVYNFSFLSDVLSRRENVSYLSMKGYETDSLPKMISELLNRLLLNESFPHEVGLFLGYPLKDVVNFEKYNGRNFSFSGYWKVYGDEEKAKKQMKMFKSCSEECLKFLEEGYSVEDAAYKYKCLINKIA